MLNYKSTTGADSEFFGGGNPKGVIIRSNFPEKLHEREENRTKRRGVDPPLKKFTTDCLEKNITRKQPLQVGNG